jgi:hypothetical protein
MGESSRVLAEPRLRGLGPLASGPKTLKGVAGDSQPSFCASPPSVSPRIFCLGERGTSKRFKVGGEGGL